MDSSFLAQIVAEARAFQLFDLLTIGTLAILEGILSVDNALVLAILVRTLPKEQQRKALTYGLVGAFVFRFVALVFAAYLMRLTLFKLIGGGYLLYLAMKHMFFFKREEGYQLKPKTAGSFWKTVGIVELTDIAFSIDSITTAVAMSDKLLIVWLGGIMGIVFLRFVSSFFIRLLEKFPRLEDLAYQLVFFIGTKLVLESFHVEMNHEVFWMMMAVITVLGISLVYRDYHQRKERVEAQNRLIDQLKKGALSEEEILSQESIPHEVIHYLHKNGQLDFRLPKNSRARESKEDE
ncbi:MAG: TerC family protein [Nitrospirae bacterium]|nr:TerC family protein [Candidatus Manganitrophaceae bacterium]